MYVYTYIYISLCIKIYIYIYIHIFLMEYLPHTTCLVSIVVSIFH